MSFKRLLLLAVFASAAVFAFAQTSHQAEVDKWLDTSNAYKRQIASIKDWLAQQKDDSQIRAYRKQIREIERDFTASTEKIHLEQRKSEPDIELVDTEVGNLDSTLQKYDSLLGEIKNWAASQ
jgi:predicted  nucleic acid-binding Zn-ribbon protein